MLTWQSHASLSLPGPLHPRLHHISRTDHSSKNPRGAETGQLRPRPVAHQPAAERRPADREPRGAERLARPREERELVDVRGDPTVGEREAGADVVDDGAAVPGELVVRLPARAAGRLARVVLEQLDLQAAGTAGQH